MFAKQYMRDNHLNVFVFVETRVSEESASKVIKALGFPNSHRVESVGFSIGIWLCSFDNYAIDVLFYHFQFILCVIPDPTSSSSFLADFVYANPNCRKRRVLWSYLRALYS
ncbi:hypothetical protein V6N13_048309 [Hibiscus sabdariffa]